MTAGSELLSEFGGLAAAPCRLCVVEISGETGAVPVSVVGDR
jgi:hypothetical protein